MRLRILWAGVCFLLLIGCAKRGAKDTGPARNEVANTKPPQPTVVTGTPVPKAGKTDDKKDEPNWLKDERLQPKNDQLPVDGPVSNGKQPWNVGAPEGGFQPGVPGVQPAPSANAATLPVPNNPIPVVPGLNAAAKPPVGTPLAPAAPPVGTTTTAKRVEEADMKEVWVFIENASGASGRMPVVATTYAALVEAKSPAAVLVKDGAIVLTGATTRESVWAFEARAYLSGGLVVTQNGVETLTAAELKKRLGK